MSQQIKKTVTATVVALAAAMAIPALAQPVQSKDPSGGPVQSKDPSGGPVPAKDKSGGPVPATSNEGMPMQPGYKPGGAATKAGGALDAGDHKFVEGAAKDGMAEVEMGKLGESKATHPKVKEFAARMVADHGKANDELKTIASAKGVTLPAAVDPAHKADADKMAKLSGDKFDHEYMEHMVKGHKKAVADFEKESKAGKDAEVRNFATKTLPTLKDHLKMAEETEAAVKKGGASAPAKK